ncbi:MAG: hypothetical protein ACTSQ5_02525 [Promethearchaeota archaeon]
MNKKVIFIFFLILLLLPIALISVQYFEVYDFLGEIIEPKEEVLVVDDNSTFVMQYSPQMCSDGAGGVIITWMDNRSGDFDIYSQRVDAKGNTLWAEEGVIICQDPDRQFSPEIIADDDGGAIILWANGSYTWPFGLYAQKINSSGQLLWTPDVDSDGVSVCGDNGFQEFYHMIPDGEGGAIISWDGSTITGDAILAQHLTSSGLIATGWDPTGIVLVDTGNTVDNPHITTDGNGGAIIVWEDYRDEIDIYAQKISSAGALGWTLNGIPICTETRFQTRPRIISDGENGAIITWGDRRGIDSDTAYDIYALRIDSNGNTVSGWNATGEGINVEIGQQGNPQIVSDGNHGAIIAWMNYSSGDYNIFAQRVSFEGNLLWVEEGIEICTFSENQYLYPIQTDGNDNIFIPWTDYRNENTTEVDIYGQLINLNGTIQWEKDGRHLVQANDSQYLAKRVNEELPVAVNVETGEIFLSWVDKRNYNDTSYDIYIKRISSPFPGDFIIGEFLQTYYGYGIIGYGLLFLIVLILLLIPSKDKNKRRKRK